MMEKSGRIINLRRIYSRYGLSIKYGLKLHKPKLLLRIMFNYVRIIFRHNPLRAIDFAPTYKCNMKCEHCFAAILDDKSRRCLTLEDYIRIADEAARLGAVHIAFQGGEPLVLKDLGELIEAVDPSRFIVSITTNGYLITEGKILEFKRLGVDMLTISIDSGIPEEHNKFRGLDGAFDKAMHVVKLAMKNGINVCINTMVTHENIRGDGLKKLISICDKYAIKLTVVLPAMVGRWQEAFDLMLDGKDYQYLDELMKKYPFIRRDLDANYLKWGCGAVKEMLYISAYGDVFPCAYIHCRLGNVKDESLYSIRNRGLMIKEFKQYHHNCLAMEDMDFIKHRMGVTVGKEKLPVDFSEMFPDYPQHITLT